jgi:hypothetical protein
VTVATRSAPANDCPLSRPQGKRYVLCSFFDTSGRRHEDAYLFRLPDRRWDDVGDSIFEHVVGSEDFEVAVAAYFAACQRWPKAKITLRQGTRVVKRNWR